ncbi:MAG: ATP-binding response regulator [Elainellaceae cyanobacterium]
MLSFDFSTLHRQSISTAVLERLYRVCREMSDDIGAVTHVLCDENFALRDSASANVAPRRFMILVSRPFSVLLLGNPSRHESSHSSSLDSNSYWLNIVFKPDQIVSFLDQLISHTQPNSTLRSLLHQAKEIPQFNDVRFQEQFTLKLIGCLADGSSVQSGLAPSSFLEPSIIERTQELKDAMIAAESASRAKSEFLSAMSHELRTPLTYIIGMSATLMRWSFDDRNSMSKSQQQSYLQHIHDRGEHLLELINNILDLSQLESGKASLNLQEFSLSRLAQRCLKDSETSATQKDIKLKLDVQLAPDCDRTVADPRRIRQILLNLLSNAIKFTNEKGEVTLSILADDEMTKIRVKDTGIGISAEQRSLVFQKFQQLDSSYQRQYEGAGLGLALTKQLAELHGGWIDFDSTERVGTVFTVGIPRRSLMVSPPEPKSEVVAISDYPKGSIIVVESHEETAYLISDMLTAAGYQVVWVLDGSTAINQIDILQPILAITAMRLPDTDGCDLVHQLRQNPSTKKLKIIALTEAHRPQDQQLANTSGADGVIIKPIQPDELLRKIDLLMTPTDKMNESRSP